MNMNQDDLRELREHLKLPIINIRVNEHLPRDKMYLVDMADNVVGIIEMATPKELRDGINKGTTNTSTTKTS